MQEVLKLNYGLIREETETIKSSEINIMDKSSTGSTISKKDLTDVFKEARLKSDRRCASKYS